MIEPVRQRYDNDCGIASLAMLLSLPWEAVWQAMEAEIGKLPWFGLTLSQLEAIARRLGVELSRAKPGQWSADDPAHYEFAGIVKVSFPAAGKKYRDGHYAVLWRGMIFDTDGRVWRLSDYLHGYDARVATRLGVGRYLDAFHRDALPLAA